MTHDEALQIYDAYFAGSLGREEVRAFHAHMNTCEDCKVRLRAMRAAAPAPGFVRRGAAGEDKLQEILRRNRIMVYAVVAILICFFFFFRLKRG
jgi:hypothetical protein